jgi:cystathionine beta-synthase
MWVAAHGFEDRPRYGDLRDLIARDFSEGGVIATGPDDSLLTAYNRMRAADISQLPVMDHGKLVGILDESDILDAVGGREGRADRFGQKVADAMTREVNTLQVQQSLDELRPLFDRDEVAVVMDGEKLVGLITRVDLINHLRRTA